MQRLLLVILLVFLPFQSIWAAASPYCGHETAADVSHVGHHVHESHAAASDVPSAADVDPAEHQPLVKTGSVDMDCHACHGAGYAVFSSVDSSAPPRGLAAPPRSSVLPLIHPPLSRPERPRWMHLA